MKTVLVTGANGFIGKNLSETLKGLGEYEVLEYSKDSPEPLESLLGKADFVFHLAGVNRPENEEDFKSGNRDLTDKILKILKEKATPTPILITSSIQAEQDNPYGLSKLAAEELVLAYQKDTSAEVFIYRLPNVFGKWSKPNYNSAVATFCYNLTHGIPFKVNDRSTKLTLAYIDDVVSSFINCLDGTEKSEKSYYNVAQSYETTLGEVVDILVSLNAVRNTLVVPDLSSFLTKHLYSTLISFYDEGEYSYDLATNVDDRGWLAEFIKSEQFGQVFISKTKPGFTRGNHWHHSKIEKFVIIDGEGKLAFRKVGGDKVFNYKVNGDKIQVIDVPVGYVHSVKNTGTTDMTMVIWANEILDKTNPDTYYEEVSK